MQHRAGHPARRLVYLLAGTLLGLVALCAAGSVWGYGTVAAQACSWRGKWKWTENGGTVTLTQAGNQVSGDDGGDQVSGTVSGNHFTGTWTHGSDVGAIDLTMASSCNSFAGT